MLNFVVDPQLLAPLVPRGTRLDTWNGRMYLSVVGFMFLDSRLWGVPVPFHARFEEVNLRFYVKRELPEGDRRGVVFIREFVPKHAVAGVARRLFGEPYSACPMRHRIELEPGESGLVEYRWKAGGAWNAVRAESLDAPTLPEPESEEEFITEHYWGYTSVGGGRSREYEVRHDPWTVRRADLGTLDCDVREVYGPRFVDAPAGEPGAAFVAEGSEVTLHRPSGKLGRFTGS